MPPDDPAARDMAPNPQKPPKKAGVALVQGTGYLDLLANWDALNRTALQQLSRPPEAPPAVVPADYEVQKKIATNSGDESLWQTSLQVRPGDDGPKQPAQLPDLNLLKQPLQDKDK